MNRLRILATLGPSSLNADTIRAMAAEGVYLFRINLSHTSLDRLEETIDLIRASGGADIPICLDSEGAQIRTQGLAGGPISLALGSKVRIDFDDTPGDNTRLSFCPTGIAREFVDGDVIDIDFYGARLEVTETSKYFATAAVVTGGDIGANKAVSLERALPLPAMTEKDIGAIEIGRRLGIEHYALSFASSAEDVDAFRERIGEEAVLISKIESIRGLHNLNPITDRSDAVLVDRGDLSREVPIDKIPFVQRRIVSSVRARGKPVYIATNLLETMIERVQPNRAEVNDLVSSLEMGATGLVLAAETAIGKHPLESVRITRRLIDHYLRWTPNTSFADLDLAISE